MSFYRNLMNEGKKMIKKAVFPVAGLGTRFLPATKACPKEMLPIVDKPLIQYAVEEAADAGITEMIFITGSSKRAIEDHFDTAVELERDLVKKEKEELLDTITSIPPKGVSCIYMRQPRPMGLGHAVYCAKSIIGEEHFAVVLADDLMIAKPSDKPVLSQMIEKYSEEFGGMVAVEEVLPEEVQNYGIVTGKKLYQGLALMDGILEKPSPDEVTSRHAVVGRYILSHKILDVLQDQKPGKAGEIQLTDAIATCLKTEKYYAYKFQGQRFDCGSKLGYLQATVTLGQQHNLTGPVFKKWLRTQQS